MAKPSGEGELCTSTRIFVRTEIALDAPFILDGTVQVEIRHVFHTELLQGFEQNWLRDIIGMAVGQLGCSVASCLP